MTEHVEHGVVDEGPEDLARAASALWADVLEHDQGVARVPSDQSAAHVRALVRHLARSSGVEVRMARIRDTVLVVRIDAGERLHGAAVRERLQAIRDA